MHLLRAQEQISRDWHQKNQNYSQSKGLAQFRINETENKVIELKNTIAELEVRSYSKKLEMEQLKENVHNTERNISLKFSA